MTRRRIAALAATTAVAGAALWWWTSSRRDAAPTVVAFAGLGVGEQQIYDLTWDGRSRADVTGMPGADGAYTGEVHVRGRLVVRGLGDDLVGFRLTDVTTASYTVMGRDVLGGVDATAGELVAVLGANGSLRELRPDPAAAPAADLLLRAIVQQSAVTVAGGGGWDALEPGPNGVARMRYRRASGNALIRTRTGYTRLAVLPVACPACREELDGVAAIRLDHRGVIRDLDDQEHLVVDDGAVRRVSLDNRFTLRATSGDVAQRPRPRLDDRVSVPPEGSAVDAGDDNARARDWSMARIGSTVMRFVATGATPVETTWMHGVAAYLREHPEACRELLRMFAAPGLPASGRDLIVSMLAATGSPAAQAALRDGIDWLAQAHGDAEVARALARVTLVAEPTAETVGWLAAQHATRDERPASASAATLALGAALHAHGDPALVARHSASLRDELAAASDAGRRIELLGALGNAGLAGDGPIIAGFAADPDAAVRHQVPVALRKLGDDDALPALLDLAGDADASVRAIALEMLDRRRLDATTARRAAQAAVDAGARGDELGAVVRLLAPHAGDEQVAATLRTLLDLVELPVVRAQIHHALAA